MQLKKEDMNKIPKVSIIVPIYNVEKYLDRCIQSLVNQTLNDIEIILVDDGSPDNCPSMCDEYAQKDNRIKVIHKQNAGLGYARNSGLDIATGEYVAFIDSDDYVDLSMYKTLYKRAETINADAVFCGFKTEIFPNNWHESKEVYEDQLWEGNNVKEFMYNMIASGKGVRQERLYQMSVWHAIYRRDIIINHNILFPSERDVVSEDIPFQIDFLKNANKVLYLNAHFYYYCLNETSLSSTFKKEKFYGYNKLRECLLSKINETEYRQRVNRLYIGYCRSYCFDLLSSNIEDKNKLYKLIFDDSVFKKVKYEFSPSFLPIHTKIMYTLMSNKTLLFLLVYIKFTRRFRDSKK